MKVTNSNKILELLLRNPAENYNINQIARELKISVGSAHKILKDFETKTVLKTAKIGNASYYKINFKNKEAQKLCELILLEDKAKRLADNPVAKVYADEIETFKSKLIILFGSILTKKQKANDVDVLFLVNKADIEEVSEFCLNISKLKTKPVIPLVMTLSDLRNKLKEKNKVVLEIIKTGVVLVGEDVFVNSLEVINE